MFRWKVPVPWDLGSIKPGLHVFSNKLLGRNHAVIINWTHDIQNAICQLKSCYNLLDTTSLIFITHGFENDITSPWVPDMKDRILTATPDATVILVNWGGGANIGILKYTQAAANTQTVGAWLALVAQEIRKVQSSESMKIWGIAHSLGAHLMGLAGRQSQAFDRITGLDPAGPCFEHVNEENRLCSTDAKMVDVIHTDGYESAFDPEDWFAPVNHYGTLIPLGKADFYPNYGCLQPGAEFLKLAGSHHRAIELFTWSILNPGMLTTNMVLAGRPQFEKPIKQLESVSELVEMGYHFDGKSEGIFYIGTEFSVPWRVKPKVCEDSPDSDPNPNEHSTGIVASMCSIV